MIATALPTALSATLAGPLTSPSGVTAEGNPDTSVRCDAPLITEMRPVPAAPVPDSATSTRPSAPTAMPRGLFRPLAATQTDGPAATAGDTTSTRQVSAVTIVVARARRATCNRDLLGFCRLDGRSAVAAVSRAVLNNMR